MALPFRVLMTEHQLLTSLVSTTTSLTATTLTIKILNIKRKTNKTLLFFYIQINFFIIIAQN